MKALGGGGVVGSNLFFILSARYRFWWGHLRERDHFGDTDIDGRIVLRWIIWKWDEGVWTGLSWFRVGTGDGHL